MTAKQAAADLQVSLSFVYKLMDQGEIAYERRGRRRLPLDVSVAEYKQRNLVPSAPKQHRPVKGQPYQFQHLFQGKGAGS